MAVTDLADDGRPLVVQPGADAAARYRVIVYESTQSWGARAPV
ncbi:hypothetical protein [Sphingomonas trueperi]